MEVSAVSDNEELTISTAPLIIEEVIHRGEQKKHQERNYELKSDSTNQAVDELISVGELRLQQGVLPAELLQLLPELFCLKPVHLRHVSMARGWTLGLLT